MLRRKSMEHPFFGRMRFMQGDYWEAELDLPGASEPLTVIVPAPEAGPTDGQVSLCRRLLGDLDGLFGRCRPLFEGEFQTWTGRALPSAWNEEFSLTGLDLPEEGDLSRPWEVTYWVPAAGHWFTAHFEGGEPSHVTVEG